MREIAHVFRWKEKITRVDVRVNTFFIRLMPEYGTPEKINFESTFCRIVEKEKNVVGKTPVDDLSLLSFNRLRGVISLTYMIIRARHVSRNFLAA